MGLADLFKSTKELEREKKRAMRAIERQYENAIDHTSDRIKEMEKKRAQVWEKARALLKAGQKSEATRLVMIYKNLGVQITKYERQVDFMQNKMNTISSAQDMKNMSKAIGDLVKVMDLDPDDFAANLDSMDEINDDVKAMDKAMNKAFEKNQQQIMDEAEALDENSVEDAELMAALESEAAAEVLGDKVATDTSKEVTSDDINAGLKRLISLLDEK